MIEVPVEGGKPFCIDTTKVTVGQYQAFLNEKGKDTSGQKAECAWNATFAPEQANPKDPPSNKCGDVAGVLSDPSRPMRCVDWCDAVAYCAWAGKRLCSGIGGKPLTIETNDTGIVPDSPIKAEWTFACTQGGKSKYPYGDTFDASKSAAAHGQLPAMIADADGACHGTIPPFDHLSGMATEMLEWEDGCDDANKLCRLRGQPFAPTPDPAAAACNVVWGMFRNQQSPGFRCCAD